MNRQAGGKRRRNRKSMLFTVGEQAGGKRLNTGETFRQEHPQMVFPLWMLYFFIDGLRE
jgi:hypothetical protein